ncbi:MAG: hypothetical protein BWX86_02556 [Verrucomicrobia bacterium ADurb.Bin122]|nr:MAG: hypothetical protein BWX86_02556 [Verrucomicrobia bacterium ADurb.Bin122]
MGDECGEPRAGLGERELKGVGIECAGAEGGGIGELAGVVLAGVFQREKHVGVLGGEGRREDAAEGVHEIVGGERGAVGPFALGAEVKGPHEAVG